MSKWIVTYRITDDSASSEVVEAEACGIEAGCLVFYDVGGILHVITSYAPNIWHVVRKVHGR